MHLRNRVMGTLFFGLMAFVGCARKDSTIVSVEGRVTLDGEPVVRYSVKFDPADDTPGSGSIGGTDSDGRYTLLDVRGQPGAHIGTYRVSFYPLTGASADNPASVVASRSSSLPEIYISPLATPVVAVVPEGGATIDILLTSSGENATTRNGPLPQ